MTSLRKTCANCSSHLKAEDDKARHKLLSKSQIRAALSSTYKLDYLNVLTTVLSTITHRDNSMINDHHQDEEIDLCTECIKVLTNLIKYLDDFNRLRRLTSYLGRTINKLDLVVQEIEVHVTNNWDDGSQQFRNNNNNWDDDSQQSRNHSSRDRVVKPEPIEDNFDDDDPMDMAMGSPAGFEDGDNSYNDDDGVPQVTNKPPPKPSSSSPSSSIVCQKGPWIHLRRLRPDEIPGYLRDRRSLRPVRPVTVETIRIVEDDEDDDDSDSVQFMDDDKDRDFKPDDDDGSDEENEKGFGQPKRAKSGNPIKRIRKPESEEKNDGSNVGRKRKKRHNNTEAPSPSPCPLCKGKVLPSALELLDHLLSEDHTPQSSLTCPICSEKLPAVTPLRNHVRGHVGLSSYPCDRCGRVYIHKTHLNDHISISHKDGEESKELEPPGRECSRCSRLFRSRYDLKRHLESHAKKDQKEAGHKCDQCGKVFGRSWDFKRHLESHARKDQKEEVVNKCDRCGKEFARSWDLKKHLEAHDRKDQRMEKKMKKLEEKTQQKEKKKIKDTTRCTNCGNRVPTNDMTDHLVFCNTPMFRHKCDECGKPFKTAEALKQHKFIHSGYKPLVCDHCGRGFIQRSVLNRHIRIHTGETPFKCPICSQAFRQKGAMDQHVRATHHGIKQHLCTECGMALTTRFGLQRHMQIHTGILPYKCQICDARFPDLRPLKKHKLTHENQEETASEEQTTQDQTTQENEAETNGEEQTKESDKEEQDFLRWM